jgi:hypothetical protein
VARGPARGQRRSADPPPAVAGRGWKYHHLGIPTDVARPGERYLDDLKIHVCGFERSPYGIEWMRFDPDCGLPDLVRTVPHLAFEVSDLDAALEGQDVLCPPASPSKGVRAAMIVVDGAPVELIEFRSGRKASGARRASGNKARTKSASKRARALRDRSKKDRRRR